MTNGGYYDGYWPYKTVYAIDRLVAETESHEWHLLKVDVVPAPDRDPPYITIYHLGREIVKQEQVPKAAASTTSSTTGIKTEDAGIPEEVEAKIEDVIVGLPWKKSQMSDGDWLPPTDVPPRVKKFMMAQSKNASGKSYTLEINGDTYNMTISSGNMAHYKAKR